MDIKSVWSWLSVGIAICAVLLNLRVAARCWRNLKEHYFFLFFFTTTTIYLHISPVFSLNANVLEGLEGYVDYYILVQSLSLVLFQIPLYYYYFREHQATAPAAIPAVLETSKTGTLLIAVASMVMALLFIAAIINNDLIFSRIGSEHLARKIVELPFYDFFIIRSYQESLFFLLGILFFSWHYATERMTRSLSLIALILNVMIWISANVLNSRASILMMGIVLLGYWLAVTRFRITRPRNLILIVTAGVLALYLSTVALTVREQGFTGQFETSYFVPNLNLLGDAQGVDRLNGIDLIARLMPEINRRGAAWGAAWSHIWWNVGRFIDPKGFDEVRLSMVNTSKGYLMSEYLGWGIPDYYSCSLTDLVGNFHILGFLFGALIFGTAYRFCRKAIHTPATGRTFVVGLFVITLILLFEQETSMLLFGWVRKLPVLLTVLALNPLKVRRAATISYGSTYVDNPDLIFSQSGNRTGRCNETAEQMMARQATYQGSKSPDQRLFPPL